MIPIAGIQPFTTMDFPGLLSCVVFTSGCPWRCRYCQNPELWDFSDNSITTRDRHEKTWKKFQKYLMKRHGLLDAVVFSGGEATAHSGLREAMVEIQSMGFKIGLHTAGIFPKKLASVLNLVNWVGFDLKAPLDQRYDLITGVNNSASLVSESLDHVIQSGVAAQFRCTWHPLLLSQLDLIEMKQYLQRRKVNAELKIQNFRSQGCQDQELNKHIINVESAIQSSREILIKA